MAIPEYKLSAVLCSHTMDVRCVATTKDSCILSASRDRTAILWHPEGIKDFVAVVTYKGHKNFVSCVCWLPPCEAFLDGMVITGSNDNTILGYQLQDATVLVTLEGHDNVVCFVAPGKESGILLSSSWDSTAKIWNVNNHKGTPLTLKGHQAAVWSIVELANDTYATASADKTIKLWNKQGAQIKTLTGHTDCVRGLVVASAESFLSCSNDASIRLWTNKGECLNTYYGHTNYIYSISMNPSLNPSSFATSGEDGSVRVWTSGECVREIPVPAQSVWSVTCLENSDIVTGSSDGIVRVFTRDPARYADEEMLKLYDAEIEKKIADSKLEIGGFKLSELPGPEILLEPGKTDGQTKLVRRGAAVKCYSWSAASQAWDEVGDVMGANPPAEGKTRHQGKEYDFVFSVDIKEGAPPLKLPYNRSEDPWAAAQAFIHTNNLPQGYLEQVANFIVTNAQVDSVPVSSNNGFADPFTGESRYVPGAATAPPPRAPAADAFTPAQDSFVPHDQYLRFDQANLTAIHDKLKEFNSKIGDGHGSLSDAQLDSIVKLGELNGVHSAESVALLKKILEWPKKILFPVLDITRLAIRNNEINAQMFDAAYGPTFIHFLITLLAPDNLPANQMLSLRVLVNAFAALPGEMAVLAAREQVVRSVSSLPNLSNNAQIAASSLLLNLSVALAQQADTVDLANCLVQLITRANNNEAYIRGIVALATLLSPTSPAALRAAVSASGALRELLQRDCAAAEPRGKAARHILSLL